MTNPAHDIIDDCLSGQLSERLAQLALASIHVFGAFRHGQYWGFDYLRMAHIHRTPNNAFNGPLREHISVSETLHRVA